METVIIAILALVSLALTAALLVVARRPDQRQGGMKDILETLVDPRVAEMRSEMNKVSDLVRDLEKDRENKFGQLTNQLKTVGEQTSLLASTTGQLREALANTRARGQWGERMAEDVLRLTGFVEGVNYLKQATIGTSGETGRARPDFTFLLPQDRKLNMDVKFPLDNYMKCMEAKTAEAETQFRQQFVRDVRDRLKEVVTRDYIDPSQKTLDYVLLFIPNEQVYQFIHEHDSSLIETAMANKVVLCSPVSLFAILLVIRQAVDNFTLEQGSNQIAAQMGAFKKQWESFVDQIDRLGKSIQVVQSHFDLLSGRRRRALERPLNRIEAIRQDLGLGLPAGSADDDAQIDLELPELELAEAGEPETR